MRIRALSGTNLVPLSLAALLACGGTTGSDPKAAATGNKLDTQEATALTAAFLDMENNQAGELDGSGPIAAGEALAMQQPPPPACVTVSEVGPGSVTWTYNACSGPHGWTWNGVTVISWTRNPDGTTLVKHDRRNMVGTKEGRTWTLNGVRDTLVNPTAKTVQVSAEPGFTKVFSNGTTTVSFAYTANLTADRSEEGKRKLYGSWALTPASGDGVGGTIAQATPLTWEKAANCCHPVSGTLNLTKGGKTATLVFGLPCGSVTVNGEAKALGACPS